MVSLSREGAKKTLGRMGILIFFMLQSRQCITYCLPRISSDRDLHRLRCLRLMVARNTCRYSDNALYTGARLRVNTGLCAINLTSSCVQIKGGFVVARISPGRRNHVDELPCFSR